MLVKYNNRSEKQLSKRDIGMMACLIEEENTDSMQVFERLGYDKGPVAYFAKRPIPEV